MLQSRAKDVSENIIEKKLQEKYAVFLEEDNHI